MFYTLLAVMKKELRQAFRDKRMAAMLLVAPVLQLTLLGYAVDLEVDRVPTVICDLDRTVPSRDLAAAMVAEETFKLVAEDIDPNRASQRLTTWEAAVAIVIPAGYARDLARRTPVAVQVLVDGTDPNRAQISANAAAQFLAERGVAISLSQLGQLAAAQGRVRSIPQVRMVPRIYYNSSLKSSIYMVPGVAAMVLLVVTTIVTAMGIAREREIGTMEQILVTPLRPSVLLLGKCLPFAFVGLIDVWAILTVGSYLFDVPLRGSAALITVSTFLYLFTTLGVGIFISTVSRSQQQAILGGFFFLMPAILLSGFMTPIENMPSWLQPLTYANPVRYYLEILRGCLLKGAGFADVAWQLAALGGFGIVLIALSAARFRKRLG